MITLVSLVTGFGLWVLSDNDIRTAKKNKRSSPIRTTTSKSFPILENNENEGSLIAPESEDIEEVDHASLSQHHEELVDLFEAQESRGAPPLSEYQLWRKNAQKPVSNERGHPNVSLVIEDAGTLSFAQWRCVQKIPVPLNLVFGPETSPKISALIERSWKRGREIWIKKDQHSLSKISKTFARMTGLVVEDEMSIIDPAFLVLSRNGLLGGLKHVVLTFPVMHRVLTQNSIIRVRPTNNVLKNMVLWVQKNKKRYTFTPLSQLYHQPKRAPVVQTSIIEESHTNRV